MLRAIAKRRNWRKSNTRVNIVNNWAEVFLFGNKIAQINLDNGDIYANHCGWATRTTLSRYKALGIRIFQRSRAWHIFGELCCFTWTYNAGGHNALPSFRLFNKDGYFVPDGINDYPEMLTVEQIKERARQAMIQEKKYSYKAVLKRNERMFRSAKTWWSDPYFF